MHSAGTRKELGNHGFNNSQSEAKTAPHLRLTADQILEHWKAGNYTAKGYLVHLFGALGPIGLPVSIPSITAFCERWEISQRSFYRARKALEDEGSLKRERMVGGLFTLGRAIISRVKNANSNATTDNCSAAISKSNATIDDRYATFDATPATIDGRTPLKPFESNGYSDRPDLSNNQIDQISQHVRERETPIVLDLDPDFEQWLRTKAAQLPTAPTLIDRWIQVQSQRPEIIAQYRSSQVQIPRPVGAAIEGVGSDFPPPADSTKIPFSAETIAPFTAAPPPPSPVVTAEKLAGPIRLAVAAGRGLSPAIAVIAQEHLAAAQSFAKDAIDRLEGDLSIGLKQLAVQLDLVDFFEHKLDAAVEF